MKRLDKLGRNADLLKDREMKNIVGGDSSDYSHNPEACIVTCRDMHPFEAISCEDYINHFECECHCD